MYKSITKLLDKTIQEVNRYMEEETETPSEYLAMALLRQSIMTTIRNLNEEVYLLQAKELEHEIDKLNSQ